MLHRFGQIAVFTVFALALFILGGCGGPAHRPMPGYPGMAGGPVPPPVLAPESGGVVVPGAPFAGYPANYPLIVPGPGWNSAPSHGGGQYIPPSGDQDAIRALAKSQANLECRMRAQEGHPCPDEKRSAKKTAKKK